MKQLVIFAVYLNIGALTDVKARYILNETYAMLRHVVDEDFQLETGTIIKWVMLGVKDQETKIECIYPVKPEAIGNEILEKLDLLEENDKIIKI